MMCLLNSVLKAMCFLVFLCYVTVQPLFIYRVYDWYVNGELEVFLSLLVLLIAPMLVVNLLSLILLLRRGDFNGSFIVQNLCVLSHCLQMGLLWRLSSIFHLFEERKVLEFSILTAGQSASSILPALLVEGVLLKPMLPTVPVTSQAFLAVGVISSALSFVLAQKALRQKREHSDNLNDSKIVLLTVCHIFGVICLFVSRCVSIVLFTYVLTFWITLLLGLHFLLCLTVNLLYTHFQLKRLNFLCVLRQSGLMYLHVFDSVTTGSGPGKCANVMYYALLLVENIMMTAVWVMTSGHTDITKLITVMIMLSSFVIGVVLKFLCHSCTDSDMAEDSDLKILQVRAASSTSINQRSSSRDLPTTHSGSAGVTDEDNQALSEINSTSATVCAKISKRSKHVNPNALSRSSRGSSLGQSSMSYHNRAFNCAANLDENPKRIVPKKSAKEKVNSRCEKGEAKTTSNTSDHDRSCSSKAKQNRTKLKSQRGYCSEEHTDIGSSNSRNTNTLDLSGHSNPTGNYLICDRDHHAEIRDKTHVEQKRREDLPECDRNLGTFAIASQPKEDAQYRPKSCAPFSSKANKPYPNDWYKYWASHWQQQEPQEAVDQYSCDFYTDTTSYYDTLSYYYTVTSASSDESDCARTWPPSLPTGLQSHVTQLPDEKLSPEERISQWLLRSRQFFSQDLLRPSNPQDGRFGSNRRTICGYTNKVSMSSTSSKRLPPRGINPRQRPQFNSGQSEEYRIQFQNYMDSLKTRKKSGGVWSCYPRPKSPTNNKSGLCDIYENRPNRQTKTMGGLNDQLQSVDIPVKPPRPPRPPRDIKHANVKQNAQNKSVTSPSCQEVSDCIPYTRHEDFHSADHLNSAREILPQHRNQPKLTDKNSPMYSRKSSPPSIPMVGYGNEKTIHSQGQYSDLSRTPYCSQKPSSPIAVLTNYNNSQTVQPEYQPSYSQKHLSPKAQGIKFYPEQNSSSHALQNAPARVPDYLHSCPSPNGQRASYSPGQHSMSPPHNPNISSSMYPIETLCESKAPTYSSDGQVTQWSDNDRGQTRDTNQMLPYSQNKSSHAVSHPNYYNDSQPVNKQDTILQSPTMNRSRPSSSIDPVTGQFYSHDIIHPPRIGHSIYSPSKLSPPVRRPNSLSAAGESNLHAQTRTLFHESVAPPYRPRKLTGPIHSKTKDIPTHKPNTGLESAV